MPTPTVTMGEGPGRLAYWQDGDFWCASYVMPGAEPKDGFLIAAARRHVIEADGRCRAEFNKFCKRSLRLFLQHAVPHATKIMGAT